VNILLSIKKPREALRCQVFQVVAKSNQRVRAGKGNVFSDQAIKGKLEAQRLSRGLARTLLPKGAKCTH